MLETERKNNEKNQLQHDVVLAKNLKAVHENIISNLREQMEPLQAELDLLKSYQTGLVKKK